MADNKQDFKSVLNHTSPIPLHYQLTEFIRKQLLDERLIDSKGKLPTEIELAEQFRVSRVTVRSALTTLLNEGLIVRKRGSGTFLKTNQHEKWIGQLMGFSETIDASGVKPGAKVLYKGKSIDTTKKVKEQLMEDKVWELKRLRYADGEPIAIEHSYFPIEIGNKINEKKEINEILTYQFIEKELKITLQEAKQFVSAVNASKEEAEILNVTEGDALIHIERLTFSIEGKPVEFLESVYRPDLFRYEVNLSRS
ncbi:GntR family transcriptional regulator [Ralstonia pickettii]|nr:GntR family transcriptional regulator [Ralstonia pickettii]